MGYDSTLLFGVYIPMDDQAKKTTYFKEYGTYFQIVSTIDLAKMGYGSAWQYLLEESPENTERLYVYWHSDTGKTEDAYGEPFKVLDIDRLIEVLEEESKSDYRRAVLALDIVKAWKKHLQRFDGSVERAVVLHYGH